jgi:hypothetical protein
MAILSLGQKVTTTIATSKFNNHNFSQEVLLSFWARLQVNHVKRSSFEFLVLIAILFITLQI